MSLKSFFSFVALFSSVITFSQSDELLNIMAKETCSCVDNKKLNFETIDENDMIMELGFCILSSYNLHKSKISEDNVISSGDSKKMKELGEKIGLKMLEFCPEVIMAIGKKKLDSQEDEEDEEFVDDNSVSFGIVKEISKKDYLTLVTKESSGKVNEFILLSNFENAYLLTDSILKIKDNIEVTYYEIELYDLKLKKFITKKIIVDLNKI